MVETFRDDIELDLLRFTLWCIEPFSNWQKLAEGAYGQVYLVRNVLDIEVKGKYYRTVVVKVPKKEGVAELKDEVEKLGVLSHENIVQILGMMNGVPPSGSEETYSKCSRLAVSGIIPPNSRVLLLQLLPAPMLDAICC